jgi:transposase
MDKKTTQKEFKGKSSVLYLAFELSSKQWKLGFTIGLGQKGRIRTIEGGATEALKSEIAAAKRRFQVPEDCAVVSCYEAGRDGFWLHRYLTKLGVKNHVVDSSSIEVNRRKRRAKSDKLDVVSLLRLLIRHHMGEPKVWSVVRVPTVEEEDGRQLHRELSVLEKEKTRTSNRIRGLLMTQGVRITGELNCSKEMLESIRLWDGRPLAAGLKARISREWDHFLFLKEQIAGLARERKHAVQKTTRDEKAPDIERIQQLHELCGIGIVSAWVLIRELFGWRQFKNGRQVGSLCGLAPTPYQSGGSNFEQGISKAGNRQVRRIAVELAWSWVRHQPNSKLSRWYNERFANGGKKARKVGIVAVARRLMVELWRYLETGTLPEGAELKSFA